MALRLPRPALLLSCLSLLLLFTTSVHATALTTAIGPNERLCFFADVDKAGEKIGVRIHGHLLITRTTTNFTPSSSISQYALPPSYHNSCALNTCLHLSQVQSGGSFDIDFEVKDPNNKVLLDGIRERQGDYVMTANTVGEYSFCFENDMSSLTEKLLDFDIMVESEARREPPAKPGQISEQTNALEESVFRLNGMLLNIKRTQK